MENELQPSPFLDPGPLTTAGSLAVLHLKRDLLLPIKLSDREADNDGYDEGPVTNTRFGSFPHSTLIGLPWGSQVRASVVDTGSRGRRGPDGEQNRKKRKLDDLEGGENRPRASTTQATGFIHILPPTPELWALSLPHRTQIVYTPDYSYILSRLRVRPGSVVIEAGAGSGSFTHAAARAVYNGRQSDVGQKVAGTRFGKVWSYEFHQQRQEKLLAELREHDLDSIVEITHRDVYGEGFLVKRETIEETAPQADAVFLDLPAPWLALRHLTRHQIRSSQPLTPVLDSAPQVAQASPPIPFESVLNPRNTVRICTFSPCIEQAQRTITTMRQLGWLEVEMVELAHRRIEIRRERVGLEDEGQRGMHVTPSSVEEALERSRDVQIRFNESQKFLKNKGDDIDEEARNGITEFHKREKPSRPTVDRATIIKSLVERKLYKEGRLTHRTEPELKTHTSYLVFALLPVPWGAEDELEALGKWPVGGKAVAEQVSNQIKKSLKKAEWAARLRNRTETASTAEEIASLTAPAQNGVADEEETSSEMMSHAIE
ncbi:MAG: tRNA (adenine-N(1)-)-methyltransferase catalytic subunit trm61 [Trizodia sp. TS-e1964]|nr:MAG: tRNA (adenine-N(1)-)-methyltransferase catalytic subunit trm61 [Trizodia sp. TS-e1964]